jgi:hypothetical protein
MSRQSAWRRYVERRRRELHDVWPCAAPTYRRLCPRHRRRVGPVTRICVHCHHGLYELLAAEYPARDNRGRDAA